MLKEFESLTDFEEAFPDERAAVDHFRTLRWPDGMACVHCGSMERVWSVGLGKHKCGDCRKYWTVRHGSIFEDSKLPLRLWFKAIFLMTSHKKGISSHQLARDLGICQKSAWFVLHRIREASQTREFQKPLTGIIEADECYVGGKSKWKHERKKIPFGRGYREGKGLWHDKQPFLGLLQRDGELRFIGLSRYTVLGHREVKGLLGRNIARGSEVHTDESQYYRWMRSEYAHRVVKHSMGEYVQGDVTTNRIEGAFGHFKRTIHGTYHQISAKHLDRYLQMFAWRWNRRDMDEGERVNALLKSGARQRITFKKLIEPAEAE